LARQHPRAGERDRAIRDRHDRVDAPARRVDHRSVRADRGADGAGPEPRGARTAAHRADARADELEGERARWRGRSAQLEADAPRSANEEAGNQPTALTR